MSPEHTSADVENYMEGKEAYEECLRGFEKALHFYIHAKIIKVTIILTWPLSLFTLVDFIKKFKAV